MGSLNRLVDEIRACTACLEHLPRGVRPIIQVSRSSRVLIVGQAPGRKVHESGIPFDDPSGERLRDWMGVTRTDFYTADKIAILPMGFCYPGTGKSGDLPPRKECAPLWRDRLMPEMPNLSLTLVIGMYAHAWYGHKGKTVTELVRNFSSYGDGLFPQCRQYCRRKPRILFHPNVVSRTRMG